MKIFDVRRVCVCIFLVSAVSSTSRSRAAPHHRHVCLYSISPSRYQIEVMGTWAINTDPHADMFCVLRTFSESRQGMEAAGILQDDSHRNKYLSRLFGSSLIAIVNNVTDTIPLRDEVSRIFRKNVKSSVTHGNQ